MSKKIWILVSMLLIATMVLAACGGEATPEPTTAPVVEEPTMAPEPTAVPVEPTVAPVEPTAVPSAEPCPDGEKTVSVWHHWEGAYLDAIAAAYADYTANVNPCVKVELTFVDSVNDSISVAIPAGEGPDIIAWANDQIGTQALAGNIVDLTTLGVDTAYLESNFEPAAVAGM